MAKTSKTVPQKEKASSSRPFGDKASVEPPTYEYVPGSCTLKIDFKVENPSSVPGRCATKDAILRPSSGEEGTKFPVPEPGKDKKQKAISRSEDPKPKTRRVRRKAIALSMDSVQRLREEEEEEKEKDDASALVIRYMKAIEVARASEPMAAVPVGVGSGIPSLDQSIPSDGTMTVGHLPSLPTFFEEALKEARELKTPDMGGGSSVGDPCQDCFTGVDDASDIGDVSLLLEEVQRFISRAISRFRVDLSQCEVELQKVSGERDALQLLSIQKDEAIKDLQADLAKLQQKVEKIGLLREEVDQIKVEGNRWKETIDRLAAEKETILAKLLSADVRLRSVKQKGLAQAKRIDELETQLVEAKTEVESSKGMADKSIALYRADVEAAQMEAREAADTADTRAHWVAELAKCRSCRETLK
ncbi:uncharacterized protein [Nicotiana tomentosiformis]|uniref:uncharacterized protein n=1 Tax=Nicotiana tomentosiformis TaxID=4098 RepID=UPI00388C8057